MATATEQSAVTAVTLELTLEEAQTLRDVTRKIGGNPDRSRRRHTDSIGQALSRLPSIETDYRSPSERDYEGGLRFKIQGV